MSLAAMSWALDREDISTAAKMALAVIGESANMHRSHVCDYHDQATLARRASMSVDTFQKRIKELAAKDYLFVVSRRAIDGTKTKNYYVVLIDDAARAHAAAHGWSPHFPTDADGDDEGCSEDRTDGEIAPIHAADCGMDEGHPCRKSTETIPHCSGMANKEGPGIYQEYPPTPQGGRGDGVASLGSAGELAGRRARRSEPEIDAARLERWDEFRRRWPWDASELVGETRAVFLRLSDDDQRAALDGAPKYVAACRERETRARNHGIVHAKRWLLGEGWAALKARSVGSAAALAGRPFTVRQGSPQAAAWARYETALHGAPRLKFFDSKAGPICMRPSEWPPPLGDGAAAPEGAASAE